jgi:ATP-binding cassette, subfamily A (ABC1), member 3
LTGFYKKDEGSIKILDLNLDENIENIRKKIGMCSQKDILYEEMTVQEHLEFIANIKGLKKQLIQQEIEEVLIKVFMR